MRLRGMKIRRFRVWVERRRRWKKSFEVWPSGDLLEIAGIFLDFSRVSPWKFSAYSLSLFTFVYGSSKISNFCSHLKCKSPQIVCQQEPESIFHQFSRGTSLKFPLESSADVSEKMSRPITFHSSFDRFTTPSNLSSFSGSPLPLQPKATFDTKPPEILHPRVENIFRLISSINYQESISRQTMKLKF
jgi:hypothetical protein